LSETVLILNRIERGMIKKMYIGLRVKYVLFLADFKNLHFLGRFSKNTQISKFHENASSGSRVVPCGRRDRQTVRRRN